MIRPPVLLDEIPHEIDLTDVPTSVAPISGAIITVLVGKVIRQPTRIRVRVVTVISDARTKNEMATVARVVISTTNR